MKQRWRLLLRTTVLVCSVLPFLPFTEWPTVMACVVAASPFISLSAALGGRTVSFITIACIPLLILAVFKQRWFCWHLCPTGFLLELASSRCRDKGGLTARFPNIANWLLFLGLGMAVAGYPLLMAFDPLAILSGFLSTWQWKHLEWQVVITALPFLGLIVLNLICPNLWCRRLCPLGSTQHFLGMALMRFNKSPTQKPALPVDVAQGGELYPSSPGSPVALGLRSQRYFGGGGCHREDPPSLQRIYGRTRWRSWLRRVPQRCTAAFGLRSQCYYGVEGCRGVLHESFSRPGVNRRFFLLTLAGGLAGLFLMPKKSGAAVSFIRPPGAVNENIFTGLCARCGNCVNVCPESIIFPDFGSSGIYGLFTPILSFDRKYCNEWCSKCVDACPTAAIRRISLEQKRLTAIGKAQLQKSICLAWTHRQHCMVCQEFCPYQAIEIVENGGVNCPEVNEALCRGCGACQNQCPAIPARAITVRGISSQELIKPVPRVE